MKNTNRKVEKIMTKEINDKMTRHSKVDRKYRIAICNELIHKENARIVASFKVDNGHKNGAEIHNIYSNGIVKIYNMNTKNLITVLIGRDWQIKSYYETCGIANYIPEGLIEYCRKHRSIRCDK